MKILLINQAFYPDVVATAQYLTDLALCLARGGHQVTVLTGRYPYAGSGAAYSRQGTYEGIHIVRVGPFSFGKKSRAFRVLNALLMNLAFTWKLLWMPDFDAVLALTTPPFVGWVAVQFAKRRKQKFFYWIMDLNPDQVIETGWISKGSWPAHFLENRLKEILRQSEKIIVLDRFMKERIMAKGIASEKVEIGPLWVSETEWEPTPHEKNPFRKEHGLEGKFVVMYSGNLSQCHPLDTLLEAALLLKEDPSIIFLFVGGGNAVPGILDFKNRHGLSNIRHLPYQARSVLKDSLSAGDMHGVSMGARLVGIVHPSKICNMLAVGCPILYIGPKESPISDVLWTVGTGAQVEHGDTAGAVRAILKAKGLSPEEKNKIAEKTRAAARAVFSQDKNTNQLLKILES